MARMSIHFLTQFPLSRRIGIDGTLHRLSVILSHQTGTDGMPPVIGVTARVGKTVEGMVDALVPDLFSSNESLLLIGRPNSGKTTCLREFARRLSEDKHKIVVVVDKTCEIGGDGTVPHPAIGDMKPQNPKPIALNVSLTKYR